MTQNHRTVKHNQVFNLQRRVIGFGVIFLFIGIWFVWRLIGLLVLDDGNRYRDFAKNKRIDQIVLPAGRGAIVDRNNVDLALTVPVKTITANPSQIENPRDSARELSLILDTELSVLEERLSQTHRQFAYLERQVEDEVAE